MISELINPEYHRTTRKPGVTTKEKHTLKKIGPRKPKGCGSIGWEALVLVFIVMLIKRRQSDRGDKKVTLFKRR